MMVCFNEGGFCFNYRVAGIAVRPSDGYLLMHRTEKDLFWAPPGGRCDMDEESPLALAREMQEEIGAEVHVGRLLYLAEVFFTDRVTTRRVHEMGLYFAMTFANERIYDHTGDFPGWEPGLPLIYRWVPPPDPANPDGPVAGFPLLPLFLRTALAAPLPETPQHIVFRENKPQIP